MASPEKLFAERLQFLPMKGGGTLVVDALGGNRQLHIVLNSVAVDDLARQLSLRNTPPSRNHSSP
jgi:hypothetical protein